MNGNKINVKKNRTTGQMIWRQFCRHKGAVVGMIMFAIIAVLTVYAQFAYDWEEDICKISTQVLQGISWEHPLGTDHMGRDLLARLLYGAKWSLGLGILIEIFSTLIGIIYGSIATYIGGKVEEAMMRVMDAYVMLPSMLIVIVLVALFGVGASNLFIAKVISNFPWRARLVRASILPIRDSDYVEAARAVGTPNWKIVVKHILPNCMSPIIVAFTMGIGSNILSLASFSFLGLGVQTPTPEWGTMLSEAKNFMSQRPDMIFYPGLMILLTVLAFNLMGDGLRDALDPKLRRK